MSTKSSEITSGRGLRQDLLSFYYVIMAAYADEKEEAKKREKKDEEAKMKRDARNINFIYIIKHYIDLATVTIRMVGGKYIYAELYFNIFNGNIFCH